METPELHKYGRMPGAKTAVLEPIILKIPSILKPLVRQYSTRIVSASGARGNVRLVAGISIAVALNLLVMLMAETLLPQLFQNGGALFFFIILIFGGSVTAGYFLSGLSVRRVALD